MVTNAGVVKPVAIAILGSDLALASRLRRLARSRALTILNLHRVDDRGGSAYEAMDPFVFEDLLRWLCKSFTVTTFAGMTEGVSYAKPPLILSFDDGYKDFIEVVAPILDRYRLNANQNVIPACIESRRPPHSVVLQDFVGTAPAQLLSDVRVPGLPRLDPADRIVSGRRAAATLKSRPMVEQTRLVAQLERHFARFDGFRPTPMMTRGDVREVQDTHEVGAHSYEHATMPMETDEYAVEDARRCLDYFESVLHWRPSVYAFPNGVARATQADLVHRAGFGYVLLTGVDLDDSQTWLHSRRLVYGRSEREARFRAVGPFQPRAPTSWGRYRRDGR